jgi:hypothetical protein
MGIAWQELVLVLICGLLLFRGSRIRELTNEMTKFGGLVYTFKYRGVRVATRVVSPPSAVEWIAIAVVIGLTMLEFLAE